MRIRTVLLLGLVLVSGLALAPAKSKKKKAGVPAIFNAAKYVYVEAEAGDIYNPNLLPEDRDAISNVMNALRDWGRYVVLPNADGSELVFIVRKGRLATTEMAGPNASPRSGPYGSPGAGPNSAPGAGSNNAPGTEPTGTQRQPPMGLPGVTMAGEAGPPDDFLEVRMRNPDGSLSNPIWEHSMSDGLDAPRVPLFEKLKRAVDHDYPRK